jgi:predicted O-methyltransferase YrrM
MDKVIEDYYKKHKEELHMLFEDLETSIEGRICHSSILLIKILCENENIKNYMEIGVHNGGSMSLMLTNKKSKRLFGLDLFEDMYKLDKHLNKDKFLKYQYFKRDNLSQTKTLNNLLKIKTKFNNTTDLKLIQGNSYFNETEEKVKLNINNEQLDLLFIDGDHTLDGVKNDFERYSKYVKKDGYIIFDDYHHEIIKKYCDSLFLKNKSYNVIYKFKSYNSNAIDLLVQKIV